MANTAAKKITYDGKPVQVESAIRDGSGKVISSTYAPQFIVETTGSGNAVTAVSYDNNKITATKGATYNNYTHPNSGVTAGTYHEVTVNAQGHVTAGTNPTTHTMTQVGGISKTYTISATGYKTIAQVSSASQYWTVNGGNSHIKCLITYSSLSTPANTATTTKLGTWIVDIAFSGINADITVTSENGNAGNANGVLRYLAAFAPKTTSYAPAIAVANYSSTSTYVTITILSCTPGWELPASFGGDPGTTNYTRFGNWEVGRYNYTWSSNKIAANITGGCDGTAGWTNGTWDRIDNDRHKSGATVVWHNGTTSYSIVGTRFCGIGSDGLVYHIAKPGQVFALPFIGGRAYTNYAANNTSVRLEYNIRGVNTTELTNVNVANNADLSASTTYTGSGTAYAYNFVFSAPGATAVTTLTIGKPLYLCGNVDSNGNFVPYYTSATGQTVSVPKGQGGFAEATNVTMQKYTFYITQTPGYNEYYDTCLFIGKCDAANNVFTYMCSNARAYTYNSSGKLTHIDGRPIQDYTLAGLGGVPTSRTINGYSLSANRTLNGADLAITGYTKPSSASALAATDTINVALGKLEKALDDKIKRGSYERIEGTSSAKKNLNNYTTAGFYNVKGQYTENCPLTGDVDYYLMVMPWNTNKWCMQICVSGNYGTANYQKMWLRSSTNADGTVWTAWSRLANASDIPATYAGSSSAGGAATSANKLNTDAGSATKPIYFEGGVPKAGTYTLGAACQNSVDNHASVGSLMGLTNWTASTNLVTRNTIAFWDGSYQSAGHPSNLTYCKKGAFGTAVTHDVETTLADDDKLPTGSAVTAAISASFAANDAMIYKGTLGTGGTPGSLPSVPYEAGWTYKVVTAGTYAGKACEIGDMVICVTDRNSEATGSNDDWTVVQNNLEAMKGATSSANGSAGYVGATPPKDGYNTKFWRADGSWAVPAYPTNTSDLTNDSGFLTSQTIKQDGVTGATVSRYAICTTGASTAAKTATIANGTLSLEAGAMVTVRFANKNSANSPTLNINSTGAKNIFHNGSQITSGTNKGMLYGACDFVYDGTQWLLIGNYLDTNNAVTQNYSTSTYNHPILMAATSGITSTASRGDKTSVLNNGIYAIPSTGTLYANSPAPATGGLRKITASTSAPTSSDGADGDVWIQYTA